MNVITKKPFLDAAQKHPNDRLALIRMYKILRAGDFGSPDELRAIFQSLDNFKYRNKWWVFDVGGNNLRVIAFIQFVNKRIFIKHLVTHPEYNKLTEYYRKNKEQGV